MKSLLAAFKSLPVPAPVAEARRPRKRWRTVRDDRIRVRLLTRQRAAIAELGRRVLEGLDGDRLLMECATLVALTLEVDACAIVESVSKDGQLIARAIYGLPERAGNFILPDTSQSFAGQTLRQNAPLITRSPVGLPVTEATVFGFPIRSSLGLVVGRPGSMPVGVLQVYCRSERRFTADDIFFAEYIAGTAAAALAHRCPKPDGGVIWEGVMFDVSELQRAQEALVAAKEEAERANRAKSEFLSRISHELRTPLNAILGFSQFLQRQAVSGMQDDCLDHIAKAGHHLLALINEVLDISRVEAGHAGLARTPVAVKDAVQEAFALVRHAATERGISLHLESAGWAAGQSVLADPSRFRQILFNLLSNAVKYNVNGGEVRVSCAAVDGEPHALEIAVADTGPGIPADKLNRLFVAFDRLGAEQSSVPGAGLGLVLVRCLAEALDGSVFAESTPGQGTIFRVRLPAADAAGAAVPPGTERMIPAGAPAAPSVPAGAETGPARRVLYIEDNASNLNLVERLLRLERPNTTLIKATCAADGMEIIRREPLDLVLLDLHLPDMPGDKVLAYVRGDPATRGLPVVVTSADATAASIDRLTDLGANAYLTKPYNLDVLLAAMQRILEGTAQAHEMHLPHRP